MSETLLLRAHVLVGATGSGKSALALRWAGQSGDCILACDSMQVYRGLDIGTAKPTKEEQSRVRHALIDWVELPSVCSAADWAEAAAACIVRENAAGRTPLICGGTGFYLRALLQGLAPIPDVPAPLHEALMARLQSEGLEALRAELRRVDAAMAARIRAGDRQRLLRALGVYHATGRPLSAWQELPPRPCVLQGRVLWLRKPRDVLRRDIARRFHRMLDAGWLEEVRRLQTMRLPDSHPAMRAVGYRQLLAYLRGTCTWEQAVDAGITATRRYAKRQDTWFRHQLRCDAQGDVAELEEYWNSCGKR